jgi:K+-transporting ATPase c subunit
MERKANPADKYVMGSFEAKSQIPRVAHERGMGECGERRLRALVDHCSEPRHPRSMGESQVNILKLNLALDANTQEEVH